jgi:hypothetical protein
VRRLRTGCARKHMEMRGEIHNSYSLPDAVRVKQNGMGSWQR